MPWIDTTPLGPPIVVVVGWCGWKAGPPWLVLSLLRRGVGVLIGLFGGESGSVTPGPIPNPVVTASSADGTALERVWESRSLPNIDVEPVETTPR